MQKKKHSKVAISLFFLTFLSSVRSRPLRPSLRYASEIYAGFDVSDLILLESEELFFQKTFRYNSTGFLAELIENIFR